MSDAQSFVGGCLCGGVRFIATGPLSDADVCHCTECRKWSGHIWASGDVPAERLAFTSDTTLRWYRSSDKVERGFCGTCGSSLFWRPLHRQKIAFALGALAAPTGLAIAHHIFTAEKGDYYAIADGLPQE
jgi:hypothetical protein